MKKSWKEMLGVLLVFLLLGGSTLGEPAAKKKDANVVTEEKVPVITIEEIVVEKNLNSEQIQEINIRVNAVNTGELALENPSVHLWVRENEEQEWRLLKTWEDNPKLEVGDRIARDFFALGTGDAEPALLSSFFQVKAEIRADKEFAMDRQAVHLDQSVAGDSDEEVYP